MPKVWRVSQWIHDFRSSVHSTGCLVKAIDVSGRQKIAPGPRDHQELTSDPGSWRLYGCRAVLNNSLTLSTSDLFYRSELAGSCFGNSPTSCKLVTTEAYLNLLLIQCGSRQLISRPRLTKWPLFQISLDITTRGQRENMAVRGVILSSN
jgi:hypothetical protein